MVSGCAGVERWQEHCTMQIEIGKVQAKQDLSYDTSEFTHSLTANMNAQLDLVKQRCVCSSKEVRYYIAEVEYKIAHAFVDFAADAYAKNVKLIFEVKYRILDGDRRVFEDQVWTASVVAIPDSSYAYLLTLEEAYERASKFLSRTIVQRMVINLSQLSK